MTTLDMDRRSFLKTTGACIAGMMLGDKALADTSSSSGISLGERRIYPLNQNWLYSPSVPSGGREAGFDDSGFAPVTLPHTNIDIPWHSIDQKSYQFVSLYRRVFQLPAETKGKHVFLDFEGVMAATTVWLNGAKVGEYKGGYTPFSFDLTSHLSWEGKNVLAVEVDSHELPEIPPFGYQIDYLTYGGIYREVALRVVPDLYIDNIFASGVDVLSSSPGLDVDVYLKAFEVPKESFSIEVLLKDGDKILSEATKNIGHPAAGNDVIKCHVELRGFGSIALWGVEKPKMYTVEARLLRAGKLEDLDSRRTGFRSARFTEQGFELNGKIIKLRGLNRHQTFPYAGPAMSARVQRKDAEILKKELKCNVVRCSHYPQSRHFLDACDDLGLMVIDETPGWQHVGDLAWQEHAVDNLERMVRRDWNHPSIILWSERINESRDFHDFYTRTNALVHKLDPTRQTTGVRYFQESEFLEDVFSMNDFGFPLKEPNHPLYLNTEFVGGVYPVRPWDQNDRQEEHVLRYARIYNQIASNVKYSGGIGWCAFDYQTHADFGSGDHICYHGVMDTFRLPKPAAGFYKSQCPPSEEPVIEPGFHFAENDQPNDLKNAVISSNCERLKCYIKRDNKWHPIIELEPAHKEFPYLEYPPFFLTLPEGNDDWGDLRLDGYVQGKCVISKSYSGKGIDQSFSVTVDDSKLKADGADATRIVVQVTDEYGATRPLCNDAVEIKVEGPATLVGNRLVGLAAGRTAFWIRAQQQEGTVRVSATHPQFGTKTVAIEISRLVKESI